MIPAEILKKVRQIQIRTSRTVNDVLAGEYQSVFKGRGMEFDEVREYVVGDEVRSIDWNVTARMGHPYVKRYVEERELTVMLLVDLSASGRFGTVEKTKNEIATELSALVAFSAIRNNDKVGLVIFTDAIEKFVPPKKGKRHVLRLIRELVYFEPKRRCTDIAGALEYLNRVTRRRAVVFLISDFLATGYEKALEIANQRHDVISVTIGDPREVDLPNVGFVELEDAETGQRLLVDTADRRFRAAFQARAEAWRQERQRRFRSMDVDVVDVRAEGRYVDPLVQFFRMRERRAARR